MLARVCDRHRLLAGPRERTHQLRGHASAERLESGEPAPPANGIRIIAPRFRAPRQLFGRTRRLGVASRALVLRPSLELGCLGKKESVEEGSGVEVERACVVAACDGLVEVDRVA